jgi:RNA polymerase sigma factor (sigma-70 family)
VSHLVRETLARVPGRVSADDLTAAGMLALVRAADSFGASADGTFTSYATTRVRAALVEALRGRDWGVREVRPSALSGTDRAATGRPRGVQEAVAELPDQLRAVVEGYFFDDRSTAEIAAGLGVGESRVAELRAEAVGLLRGVLTAAPSLGPAKREGALAASRSSTYAGLASHRGHLGRLTLRAPQPGTRSA